MELLLLLAAAWVLCVPLALLLWVARHGERLHEAEKRARSLEREVRQLRDRLERLPSQEPPPASAAREPRVWHVAPVEDEQSHAVAPESAEASPPVDPPSPGRHTQPERIPLGTAPARAGVDWERWLGVRGAAVVGGVALALAGLFFVQLAIQRGWIGPALRDGLAVGAGALALAAFSPLHRRGYHAQAAALGGAGTVLVYLGAWAAARVHGLVPIGAAFLAMSATTLVAGRLAVRSVAPVLAVFALVGGFATPLLLDLGVRSTGALFVYLALLNLAALTIGSKPGWAWVPRLCVGATAVVQLVWYLPALLGGTGAPRPSLTTLAALLSVPAVHAIAASLFARPERHSSARRAPTGALAASATIALQVLFAAHLGAELDVEATLWPIGAFGLLLALLAGWIGRGLGLAHAPALGALGGIAVLAVWTELHPARHGDDFVRSRALFDQFSVCAAALVGALLVFERRAAIGSRQATAALSAAVAALLVILGFAQDLAQHAAPLRVTAAVAVLAAAALAAVGQGPLLRVVAPLVGALAGFTVAASVTPADAEGAAPMTALHCLLGLVAGGALAALRWPSVGSAVLCCAAAGLARAAFGVPSVLPLPALGLAVCAGLATLFALRSKPQVAPNQAGDYSAMTIGVGAFSCALALSAMVLLTDAAFELATFTPLTSAALIAAALPVPLALALGRGRHLALPGWLAAAPALAALSPALGVLAQRTAAGSHAHALWLAAAALPPALAGSVALGHRRVSAVAPSAGAGRGGAELAAPLLAVAGVLVAAALARAVGPYPRLVTVALGGTLAALSGVALGRRDVQRAGGALGLLGALAFVLAGLDGRAFLREEAVLAPRLAWSAIAALAAAALARPAFGARAAGIATLAVAFLWLNLGVVNHFASGAYIALQEARAAERDLALSAAWLAYVALLLTVGMWRGTRGLRWASLAVLIATVFKVFLYDLSALRGGERALSFLGLAVALFAVSLVYQRWVLPARRTTAPNAANTNPSPIKDEPTA